MKARLAAAVVKRIVGSSPEPIRALGVHDDALPLAAPEPEEIDVIPRDPALDDQRRLGKRLSRLEGAVVFLLGDLRELADREQEGIRDPVVGLNADRVDADGRFGGHDQLELPARGITLGLRRFRAIRERGDQAGVAVEIRPDDGDLRRDAALDRLSA